MSVAGSGHVMVTSCDVMACVVSCHVMQRDVMVMSCTTPVLSVLQSTTQVLPYSTKYYSSTTLSYKVLLQYCPELQSTTPVLPCTTKYYSSTTLYYTVLLLKYCKVLLQYYLVLQSTTPVLTCTTKYYSVLQSTTPVLPCTTKY